MANVRRFDSEQEAQLLKMYQDGQSAARIARQFGVNAQTVRAALIRQGVDPSRRSGYFKDLTLTQVLQMAEDYKLGATHEELAVKYGVAHSSAVSLILKRVGVQARPAGFRTGKDHHNWKGGRIEREGYIHVLIYPDDPYYEMAKVKSPNANGGRYVLEHRYKMAQKLGRCLADDETVHHKDDNGLNNNLKNLQLRQGKHGKGASFRCCDCGSYNVKATALAG